LADAFFGEMISGGTIPPHSFVSVSPLLRVIAIGDVSFCG
jgi:hypothetical protein